MSKKRNSEPPTALIRLRRDDWTIELPAPVWAEILLFLSKAGLRLSVPGHSLLADGYSVSEQDAALLAAAGEIVLEETAKSPLDAFQTIRFDMGKCAEIVTFAGEGPFLIHNSAANP